MVLQAAQGDLPDSAAPFEDIAALAGTDEATVLDLLRRLKAEGVIRRFGASIKHQHAGWTYNSMIAWEADAERADEAGPKAAGHPNVSHCYFRPSQAADWPYTLFTMVHGRSSEEVAAVMEDLRALTGLEHCVVLQSVKEVKKTSMTYF